MPRTSRRRHPRHTTPERFRLNGSAELFRSERTIGALEAQADRLTGFASGRNAAALNGSEQIFLAGHGYSNGDGPIRLSTDGTIPAGLSEGVDYFPRNINANNITLHPTAADAIAGNATVKFSDDGTGQLQVVDPIEWPAVLEAQRTMKPETIKDATALPVA